MCSSDLVLIVGGGTGGETFALRSLGCDVVVIEPDADAVAILRLKATVCGLPMAQIHETGGEQLPFADGEFDWVWCHTVLEHVRDVEMCVAEIVRVMKPRSEERRVGKECRSRWSPYQ